MFDGATKTRIDSARDIFKGVFLPCSDPETRNLFLKEIDGFTYEHSERLVDAFGYPP